MNRKQEFEENGYIIEKILSDSQLTEFRALVEEIFANAKSLPPLPREYTATGKPRDQLSDFGDEARQYYLHLLTADGAQSILHAFHIPKILEIVSEIIGPKPIINNASILASNPDADYSLAWHRDVIQVPQEEIHDGLFSPDWPHNSVQINLALHDDSIFWIVPKSHNRPNTAEEDACFAGSKHFAPIGNKMPNGVPVHLPAGYATLYNNNMIHRGHNDRSPIPRRTLHMGYHSATRKPTWHFHVLNADKITPSYLDSLQPEIKSMIDDYVECRKQFPDNRPTWQPGWPGVVKDEG